MRAHAITIGFILGSGAVSYAQCEAQRLLPADLAEGGNFGFRIVMDAQHLIISNPSEPTLCPDPFSCVTGMVRSFEFDGTQWVLRQSIVPPDVTPRSTFGSDIDLDGSRMIVGSSGADLVEPGTGGAYIYDHDGEEWIETARIAPPEPHFRAGFGSVVAIDGNVALIRQTRTIYVFEQVGEQWIERQRITQPEGLPSWASFGNSFELTGDWLLIGAHMDRTLGSNAGSVHVYRRTGPASFEYSARLDPPDIETGPRFGSFIAAHGHRLFIGGPLSDREMQWQGAAYYYENVGEEWILRQEITHEQPTGSDNFGTVAFDGHTLVVGAPDQSFPTHRGAAYAFEQSSDGVWRQRGILLPTGPAGGFGTSVAVHDRRAAAGAPWESSGGFTVGAAYAFDLACLICKPDFDGDGALTIFDFLAFQTAFGTGDMAADFDGDGQLTIFDFLAFQTAFALGCE